jgi:acyl carrier protein
MAGGNVDKTNKNQLVRMDVLLQLKKLVLQVSPIKGSTDQIQDDANLYGDWLDSTSVVELVLRIEEFFAITVTADDVEIELFQDLGRLTDMVMEKLLQEAHQISI